MPPWHWPNNLAGSEDAFAALMNRQAQRLGMKGTHFVNSTGLPDPNHYSTARDLATLASAIIRDDPAHYSWYAVREYTYNKITQPKDRVVPEVNPMNPRYRLFIEAWKRLPLPLANLVGARLSPYLS